MNADPIFALVHTINPQTIKAAFAYKESLLKIDSQLQMIWRGHKSSVDSMSLTNDQLWKKRDWRQWKSKTFTLWKKECLVQRSIMQGKHHSSVDDQERRALFINCLKERSLLVDPTNAFSNKVEEIISALFASDDTKKQKANITREATQKRDREMAQIEQKYAEQKAEEKRQREQKKAKIEAISKETGLTLEEAAFINSYTTQKK